MVHAAPQTRFGRVELATGPRLAFAEQGDRNAAPIVFLHGWPDSWFSFSHVLDGLEDHHSYAIDQRGFGESEAPDCCYWIDDFAADVVAFLDAVGLERATLVGHSFGTFVARRVAETEPRRVQGLVLIGSAAHPVNDVTREVLDALRDLPDPVPREFAHEFQAGTLHMPLPEPFFERIVAESMKLAPRLWREVFDRMLAYDDRDALGSIQAPALLIWGEHDALFSREDQDRLVAAIPDAELRVYPDDGHCPNWEHPERVAADIDEFVRAA